GRGRHEAKRSAGEGRVICRFICAWRRSFARDDRLMRHRGLIWLIAAVVAVQPWLAHRYYGFLTGDDLEIIAEAFRRAVGFRYTPWNIRSLLVPDLLVAPVVFVGHAFGVSDTRSLIEIASLPFIALSAWSIWLVHRLALQWTEDARVASVAALLFALHWIPLGFGSTVYPRTLATACV